MQTKNAVGNLINRYKAVLKKCHLLNTFGSLAMASVLVVGSAQLAVANDVNISGTLGSNVSLNADDGNPSEDDKLTTAAHSKGDFTLSIDDRDLSLDTMTVGNKVLGGNLTVELVKSSLGTITDFTSNTLNVVADNTPGETFDTTYIISTGLTHTVNGLVSIQPNEGQAQILVDGTLHLNTSAGGEAGTIKRGSGNISDALLYVNGTLSASDGTQATDLNLKEITLTLNSATVNAASLNLDSTTTLILEGGESIIQGNMLAGNDIAINGGDTLVVEGSLTANAYVDIIGANATSIASGTNASLVIQGGGSLTNLTLQNGADSGGQRGGIATLNVSGADKVVSVTGSYANNTNSVVNISNGATFDVSGTELTDTFIGKTVLNGGIFKTGNLDIPSNILTSTPENGKISFDATNSGILEASTLQFTDNVPSLTLDTPGAYIKLSNLADGLDITNITLGSQLRGFEFTGGGSINENLTVSSLANMTISADADDPQVFRTTTLESDLNLNGRLWVEENAIFEVQPGSNFTVANSARVNLSGTVDLTNINTQTIEGAYTLHENGTLKLNNLTVDTADLLYTGNAAYGQILFNSPNSLLSIGDTLTLSGNELGRGSIAMQSFVGDVNGTRLGADSNFIFNGGGTIHNNLNVASGGSVTIANSGLNTADRTNNAAIAGENALPSIDPANITRLGGGVELNFDTGSKLNIASGSLFDATEGTLTVADGSFTEVLVPTVPHSTDVFSSSFTYAAAGTDGLGILRVDESSVIGEHATIMDNFWGDLVVVTQDASMTYEEYKSYLSGANTLIQGNYATLQFVNPDNKSIEITGVDATLNELISGDTTFVDKEIRIGTGIVNAGFIEVGSVFGDNVADITLNNKEATLQINGTANNGDLFTNLGSGEIKVNAGVLLLGNANNDSFLNTDITLGGATNADRSVLIIAGSVDMSKQTLIGHATSLENNVYVEGHASADVNYVLGTLDAENTIITVDDYSGDAFATKMTVYSGQDSASPDANLFVAGDKASFEFIGSESLNSKDLNISNVALIDGATLTVAGGYAPPSYVNNVSMAVTGEIQAANGTINVIGGNAVGAKSPNNSNLTIGNAILGTVNISGGIKELPDANSGGIATFSVSNGVASVGTINNNRNQGATLLRVGSSTAAAQLSVANLNNDSAINIEEYHADNLDTVLKVTDTYVESSDSAVNFFGSNNERAILDLSATSFGKALADGSAYTVQGIYNFFSGGVVIADDLTVDSSNIKDKFNFEQANSGALYAKDSITFTDTGKVSLDDDNMTLATKTLNSADLTLDKNTELVFVGGGTINANLTTANTGTLSIKRDATDFGVDSPTGSITTLSAEKSIFANSADSLNVAQGSTLDVSKGTLQVGVGAFTDGPAMQAASGGVEDGIGTIIINASDLGFTSADPSSLLQNANTKVQDDFWGTYNVVGLSGSMTYAQYQDYLVSGNNALIQGNNSSLNLGADVTFSDIKDYVLNELVSGTHVNEAIKIGSGLVEQGGMLSVGSVVQDSNTPKDIIISNNTTLNLTGKNDNTELFQGNTDNKILIEHGTAVFGSAGVDATLNADVVFGASGDSSHAIFNGNVDMSGNSISRTLGADDNVTIQNGAKVQINEVETATLNLTENSELTLQELAITDKGSVGTLNADGIAVEGSGSLTAETLKLNNAEFTVYNGVVNAENLIMDTQSNFFTGSNVIGGQGTSIIASFQGNGGWVGTETAWHSDPALNTPSTASLQVLKSFTDNTPIPDTRVNAKIGSFQNGLTALGSLDEAGRVFTDGINDDNRLVTEMNGLVQAGLISWGDTTHDAANTTSAIAFYAPMVLNPANSLIAVDGSVTIENDGSLKVGDLYYTPTYNTATFAANSLAIVDANAMADGVAALSTGTTIAHGLTVNKDADLVIMGGHGGQKLTVLEGFEPASGLSVDGWGENPEQSSAQGKLIFDSRLMAANPANYDNNWDATTNSFVVDMDAAEASSVYGKMQSGLGTFFDFVADQGFDVYSQNEGVRFISRLDSQSYNPNMSNENIAQSFESAAQMAQVGAVNRMTIDAILTGANASTTRNSTYKIASDEQNVAVVHIDESGDVLSGDVNGASAGSTNESMKNGVGLWLMPLYKWNNVSDFEAGNFEHDYTSNIGGIALGADYTFNNMFRVGASFNAGTGSAESTGDLSKTSNDFDFWGIGLYGAYTKNNFNLVADMGYTKTSNELDQILPSSMAMGNLNTEIDASAFTLGLNAEYIIKTEAMDIIPHAGVRYVSVSTDGYDVQNSVGTLFEAEKQSQDVFYFPVGVTAQKEIVMDNGWSLTPRVDVGAIIAAGDLNAVTQANISGLSTGGELEMQNVDGFAFNGGLGFDIANADNSLSFGLDYNMQVSEHETGHKVFATFKYEF